MSEPGRDAAGAAHARRARGSIPFWARVIGLVGSAVVVSVLAGAWWTYRDINEVVIERELREVSLRSEAVVSPLRESIDAARTATSLVRATPPVAAWTRAVAAGGIDPESEDSLAEWRARLETIMLAVARGRDDFLQLRFIGVADGGRELLRIDRAPGAQPVVVPDSLLQPKGDRPYFIETIGLPVGEVYVSDVELNQENGVIEEPWVPTIRTGTPVFGPDGEVFGAIVVNMDLRPAFRAMRASLPVGFEAYIVDDRGDFILHPDSTRTFRLDFGEPGSAAEDFPEASRMLAVGGFRADQSYLAQPDGVLTGVGVYPLHFDPSRPTRYLGSVVTQDLAGVTAAAAAARNRAVAGAMLALPLALLIGWWTLRSVHRALGAEPEELDEVSASIATGNLAVDLPGRRGARQGVLAALEAMLENLRDAHDRLERRAWIQSNLARTIGKVQRASSQEDFCSVVLDDLCETLEAGHGVAFTVTDDGGSLRPAAWYAVDGRERSEAEIPFGHGVVGQAAASQRRIVLDHLPESYLAISSGLGRAAPSRLVAIPLVHEGRTLGVFELATFGDFDGARTELLDEVTEDLSVALWGLRARDDSLRLMRVAQDASEELQVTNEELEMRSEELRRQSEELEALNASLEEKSEELERRRLEAERERAVVERQNRELEQTSRRLEEASRYKSEFLANMSHELRTPLNSLLILSRALADNPEGNLTAEQVRSAEIVHSGGTSLLELINDILDLSKIEAGRVDIAPAEVEVRDFLQDLRRHFEPVAKRSEIAFRVIEGEGAPSTLVTDRQRVEQILKNFLSNAFKFTREGEVCLRYARAGESVAFRVSDTGIGIPEDKLTVVFEAFRQADGSTSREFGGTGLGLTISANLAALLGGSIELESTEGEGSTFSLLLPQSIGARAESVEGDPGEAVRAAEGEVGADMPPVSTPGEEDELETVPSLEAEDWIDDDRARLDGRRPVLVVEDDRAFAEILRDLARERGHPVVATASGRAALRHARGLDPAAILLDLGLPDLDGLAVLDQLKSDSDTKHVPVHVVSALDERPRSLSHGAVGFLAKPATREGLERAFEALEAPMEGGARRVLVVENEGAPAEEIVRVLAGTGADVERAETLEDAREALDREAFDCMVLDLVLPDGERLAFLEERAASGADARIPVVVHADDEIDDGLHQRLRAATDGVVLDGPDSADRLLDEVALFLHTVDGDPDQAATRRIERRDASLQGRRVLVVDDDLRNAFALSHVLSSRGVEVVLAEDGQHAIERLGRDPDFDLVLMDVMMPRMDGYEATRRLREDERFRTLPIIALTAKAMPQDRTRCLEAGASDYLSKPIDLDRLLSVMRAWVTDR